MSLRKCSRCGLEAKTEEDLKLFVVKKDNKYQKGNLCKKCFNKIYNKKWNPINNPINSSINNPRRITFKGKQFYLVDNPRTNICSNCGKKYPEELIRQTDLHHIIYDNDNPILNTIELCLSCHTKLHRSL